MVDLITANQAEAHLASGEEIAFLDVREPGPFSEGHAFAAVPCPWSGFELTVARLVPRRDVPIMLIDAGSGEAEHCAHVLERNGYADVRLVEGGTPGWARAGFTLFKGVHVPSKTLGELAEETHLPRALAAQTLSAWKAEGRSFYLYDCRPGDEHSKMTVPGAICIPNGELPHRLQALPDDGPIVLTCAGRTRGLIGAASLKMVAPDREVYWLEDGTQGWFLAGLDLERGKRPEPLPELGGPAETAAQERADRLIASERIASITAGEVRSLVADPSRTTFLFDVRSPDESGQDPIAGFRAVPSVQLLQATDRWIGVRRARVVLADDAGLRAAIAAYWLRMLGFETFVVRISDDLRGLDLPAPAGLPVAAAPRVGPKSALNDVANGRARFVDVRSSASYTSGHVAGATWSIRPRLSALPQRPPCLYLIGDGSLRADMAAATLRRSGYLQVMVVEGGMPALVTAGATMTRGRPLPLDEAIDITSFAHGRHDGDTKASETYLAWEKGLLSQLSDTERGLFRP